MGAASSLSSGRETAGVGWPSLDRLASCCHAWCFARRWYIREAAHWCPLHTVLFLRGQRTSISPASYVPHPMIAFFFHGFVRCLPSTTRSARNSTTLRLYRRNATQGHTICQMGPTRQAIREASGPTIIVPQQGLHTYVKCDANHVRESRYVHTLPQKKKKGYVHTQRVSVHPKTNQTPTVRALCRLVK